MTEPATFDESDWSDLSGPDKKALRILDHYGFSLAFEPLARAAGVGQASAEALVQKRLLVEGQRGLHGRYFKITDKGVLAVEWLHGRKMRVYPSTT